ncbi:hypothetical protein HCUR_00459 [Holospora curviuscula]|uniref:Uncharacterized protein n=1 Tax=Holospora curviuscula TaxID=1082868 RepID=A0A2S5RAD0_9PROT|nr:hypothetical protein HCUR_00459 [Holospora curviuscula]
MKKVLSHIIDTAKQETLCPKKLLQNVDFNTTVQKNVSRFQQIHSDFIECVLNMV